MTKAALIPLEEALKTLSDNVTATENTESISLSDSLNRVISTDICAPITQPPFDNSAVDGYAFNFRDSSAAENELGLELAIRIAAGDAPSSLPPLSAARIFTGAPVPLGADCVIMQENALIESRDGRDYIRSAKTVELNQNIRPAGQDYKQGQVLARQGDVLRPQLIGLLASAGIAQVDVYQPLRVAVLSTGDELVEPGQPLEPGQIYNSNRYLLQSLLQSFGFHVVDIGIVEDSLDASKDALRKASDADIIISSGGASIGEEDYIKKAIESLGVLDFWRIALKPGKPFMLGQVSGTPILGLPGNPSAVFVTFLILARSVLLKRQGCRTQCYRSMLVPIDQDITKSGVRREFLRVRLDNGRLVAHSNQSSGMMSSSSWAEGFAVIREHTMPKAGERVEFIPFSSLLAYPETLLEIE